MYRSKLRFVWSLSLVLTLVLAACGGGGGALTPTGAVPQTGVTPADTVAAVPTEAEVMASPTVGEEVMETPTEEMMETPTEAAMEATEPAAGGGAMAPTLPSDIGGTVTVLAIWGGAELDNFLAMMEPFEQQTGIEVQYEGTRDLGAVLNTRISGGNPPDVAGLPNPGQLVTLAQAGSLIPLGDVLPMDYMTENYDPGFLDLASVDGEMYGIWTKAAVKSLVWYAPAQFEANGYTVPTTWEELDALEQQIIDDGFTPWCIGINGGGGSGWPGTDWVEDIMLRTGGVETYDQWWQHEIPWTDDAVRNAFETWGTIVADPAMAFGGPTNVISASFDSAFFPMFEDPPQCFMHRQASFITTFFDEQFPENVAGEDYNFFAFPPIDEAVGNPLLVAGDLFGMFNDTPQARAFIQYLVTAEAQSIWAERGGFLSANRSVDPATYPDVITQQIGEMLVEAKAVRFDASDLMPQEVSSAFSQAVLNYVSDPSSLDAILEETEGVAEGAYQPTQ